MFKFIQRIFKDRYRGTAVKQVDGTEIPAPFPANHGVTYTPVMPVRYCFVTDFRGSWFIIPESAKLHWRENYYNRINGADFDGAMNAHGIHSWTFERPVRSLVEL